MKKLWPIALALSLAANAALLWRLQARRPRDADHGDSAANPSSPGPARAGANANATKKSAAIDDTAPKPGVVWRKATTPEELKKLAAELRAAGFPEDEVRALIFRTVSNRARERAEWRQLPFWHQNYNAKAHRELREKLGSEANTLAQEVLGKETSNYPRDSIYRTARFGDLPDDKVATLEKIEQDYGEVYWKQRRGADGLDALESYEGRARIRLLEEEKEKDLAAVLTPDELRDYQRRGSRGARTVIDGVGDINVTEAEFDALYALQRGYLESLPRDRGVAELTAAVHSNAAPAEQVRAILGDDRFYSYLAKTDPIYRDTAAFAKTQADLPPARVYQLYQLQSAALLAAAQTGDGLNLDQLAFSAAGRAAVAPFQAQLDALLGPELAATYRRSASGRIFAGGK